MVLLKHGACVLDVYMGFFKIRFLIIFIRCGLCIVSLKLFDSDCEVLTLEMCLQGELCLLELFSHVTEPSGSGDGASYISH